MVARWHRSRLRESPYPTASHIPPQTAKLIGGDNDAFRESCRADRAGRRADRYDRLRHRHAGVPGADHAARPCRDRRCDADRGLYARRLRRRAILCRTRARQFERPVRAPPGADRVDAGVRGGLCADGVGADAGVAFSGARDRRNRGGGLRSGEFGDRRRDPARETQRRVRLYQRGVRDRLHHRTGAGRIARRHGRARAVHRGGRCSRLPMQR